MAQVITELSISILFELSIEPMNISHLYKKISCSGGRPAIYKSVTKLVKDNLVFILSDGKGGVLYGIPELYEEDICF